MNPIPTLAELAMLYFPDSTPRNAVRRFNRLVKADPQMHKELCQAGYRPHQRVFTPKQYGIILQYVGEP